MTIAAIPSATMLIKNTVIAMSTIQVPLPPIERAAWQNNLVLAGYITALGIAALMTFLSWYFGGRLQGLIRKDADARIAEADSKAAGANERAAVANAEAAKANEGLAKANAEVARLTKESLQTQFNLEKTKTSVLEAKANVFDLQRAAADAKAAQQRVEIDLATAKAETAKAQQAATEAAELAAREKWERERIERLSLPRNLNLFRRSEYIKELSAFKGTEILFITVPDTEPTRTAQMIADLVAEAGWKVLGIEPRAGTTEAQIPDGVWIEVQGMVGPGPQQSPLVPAIERLRDILNDSSIGTQRSGVRLWLAPTTLPKNLVRVLVGLRDDPLRFKKLEEEIERERLHRRENAPPKPNPE